MRTNKYWFEAGGKKVANEEAMLSKLLDDDVLFCNNRQIHCPFSNEVGEMTIVLFININDVFCHAADAESLTLSELPSLFQLYLDKSFDGVIEFVALKRKMQPRKRVKERMIRENTWRNELDHLKENVL